MSMKPGPSRFIEFTMLTSVKREQCLVVEVGNVCEVLKDAEEVWGIRGDVGGSWWYLKG